MTSGSVAIYVIGQGLNEDKTIELGLTRVAALTERLLIVCEDNAVERYRDLIDSLPGAEMVQFDDEVHTPLAGWRQGLVSIFDTGVNGPVLLTGSHVFGPVKDQGEQGFTPAEGVAVLAPFWHDCSLDVRLSKGKQPDRVPHLDFTWLSADLLRDPAVQDFWRGLKPLDNPWEDFEGAVIGFGRLLDAGGYEVAYPMPDDTMGSVEPRFYEIDRALGAGCPCMPISILLLDPLIHDLSAINVRGALDWLRGHDPDLYAAVIRYATRHVKLRDFCTIADQYEIISQRPHSPQKEHWSFGTIAVFIHAFYAEMMPEFWVMIERLPQDVHLFITTATEENADSIRAFLSDKGWPADAGEVRVVEENRGRDMSSLFITWRDIALSGTYEVALRLHSKRTPQVARQVGESFKAHLFENLVGSNDHVRNILDMMEAQPDIGLVIPPVIHVGFGTLGHAWYNNRTALAELAEDLYINVPLDDHTPVGAYGTMYWFRTDAMFKMFDWGWKWSDYNPEPHHIDGGVAHVQERLIAYAVQDRGYRVMQVMTPQMAGRNYGRLEYKAQMYASEFASNNVMDHRHEMEARGTTFRGYVYKRLREVYGRTLRRYPASRAMLRPFKNAAVAMLIRRG